MDRNWQWVSVQRVVTAYLEATDDQENVVATSLSTLLGLLRAQAFSYQTSHWQVEGHDAYGNHLLFARLYESVLEQIDQLAEKMVGYLGPASVEPVPSNEAVTAWLTKWAGTECPFHRGLESEADFQTAVKQAYDAIDASGVMTLGLDDWLMAAANAHDSNTYLLQQTMRKQGDPPQASMPAPEPASVQPAPPPAPVQVMPAPVQMPPAQQYHMAGAVAAAPSGEEHFFDNPERREVREFAQTGFGNDPEEQEVAQSTALSNDPEVVLKALPEETGDTTVYTELAKAEEAPPTPSEILEEPGAEAVSTLNRFIVETEEPVPGVPDGHDEVPKHPNIQASLLQEWGSTL